MRIAISGATGMIGRALTFALQAKGHEIHLITRQRSVKSPHTPVIVWDPQLDYIELEKLEGLDVLIHLAGANVGEPWTPGRKMEILASRVGTSRLLCESLSRLKSKPKLLISASAVGYYGNHPADLVLDEMSPAGTGFLADVCRQWEAEISPAADMGIRTVFMRMGVVLSPKGGALGQMRLPFQLGLGGRLGNGEQMMSWVALDEIPHVVEHLIKDEAVCGAVNVVSPCPVTNALFAQMLGQAMHRPAVVPVPDFMVRLMFGEMGQHLLLEGARVRPRRLQESGYRFRYPDIKEALDHLCHTLS